MFGLSEGFTVGKSITWIAPKAVTAVAALTALALSANAPRAQAGDGPENLCPRGTAILHGAYMSQGGGTVLGVGPVAFQGTVYVDGKGKVTNPFTASFAGTIVRVVAPGTYTVESDCTGTMVLLTPGAETHLDIRVSPDGNRIDFFETEAGSIVSGRATRVSD